MLVALGQWITGLISAGGYGAVVLLMALESACVPLPSEVIMPFAGSLVASGRFSLVLVALAGAIGCNLGSWPAYWVGATGGRAFVARYGRFVLLSEADLDRADRFFHRFGPAAVFLGRLLPLIRTIIAVPAGVGRMKQIPFHLYTFAGSFIWCYVLATIGDRLGRAWDSNPGLHVAMKKLDLVAVVLVVAALAWFVWSHVGRRKT